MAAAPLIWAASDWIVTGDPLHSLHGTAALAEEADRRRSPEQVPYWTAKYFGYALREPMVIGVPIGLGFAWLYTRRSGRRCRSAVVVAMTAVFAVGPLFGLPLIRRYVETPAVLLTLFYGLAVAGWVLLPPGRARQPLDGGRRARDGAVDRLRAVARRQAAGRRPPDRGRRPRCTPTSRSRAEAPVVRAAFERCAPLTAADHRPIPFARFWLGGAPGSVTTVENGASPMGKMLLLPRRNRSTGRVYSKRTFPRVRPPDGFRQIYRNPSWRVFAAPGCAG